MIYSENILICIAIPLLIAIIFTKRSTRRFITSFILGMIICLISAYFSGFIKFVTGTSMDDTAVLYSPIVEEILKMLPILFYIVVFQQKDDKIFIVAVGIGLGFATFENCCYILSSGASDIAYVLIRGMAVGIMHLVCALLLVLGLSLARYFRVLAIPAGIGALAIPTVFHGLYNLLVSKPGVSSYLGYTIPILTAVILYIPYRKVMNEEREELIDYRRTK
ncbi:MAG: PrsW family intramembrane metalloprotease [Lachnospiraceae bacterium]|nr:PrsW family intramembrane metalloprotease [Lachnospiraceae bacterium]